MADLIIQPKNDDHLKLNNDAGTTILELANDESKLRLAQNNISASDGTTAITTSGANVTLAGTSNNIGTVTSGTFNGTIGDSATFPSGVIIKAKTQTFASSASSSTTSWTSSPFKASNSVTFDPISGNSNIILIATFQAYTTASYGFFDFYKNASDFSETYNLSGRTYGLGVIDLSTSWESKSIMFIDPISENSTSQKTYSVSARAHSSGGYVYLGFDSAGTFQTITMMEIAV